MITKPVGNPLAVYNIQYYIISKINVDYATGGYNLSTSITIYQESYCNTLYAAKVIVL